MPLKKLVDAELIDSKTIELDILIKLKVFVIYHVKPSTALTAPQEGSSVAIKIQFIVMSLFNSKSLKVNFQLDPNQRGRVIKLIDYIGYKKIETSHRLKRVLLTHKVIRTAGDLCKKQTLAFNTSYLSIKCK